MATQNFPTIKKVLEDGGRILAESIAAEAPFRTGALARSFRPLPLTEQDGKFQLNIESLEYASYQDEGVNGTVTNHGSRFSYKGTYKMIGGDLPYGARVNIYKNGLKPQPFIQRGADRVIDGYFAPQLENAGVTDIENIVTRDIDNSQYIEVT